MGWTSFQDMPGMTPAQILCREFDHVSDNGTKWRIVDHATKLNQFYCIVSRTVPGADPVLFGMVVLFKRYKKTGEFSYKPIDESCGPSADRCPVRLINTLDQLAPIDPADNSMSAQWARDWRARCRANAKRKPAPPVKPGDIVKFSDNGREFELISPAGPRRGWHVKLSGANGSLYRATARQIANCQIVGG